MPSHVAIVPVADLAWQMAERHTDFALSTLSCEALVVAERLDASICVWLGDDGPPSALQNLVHRASLGFGAHGVSADARAAMLELAQQGSLRAIDEGQTDEDTPSSDESGEEGAQPVRRVESPSTLLREHSRAQIAEAAAKINPYQCCGEADDDGWVVIDAVRCALAAAVAWRAALPPTPPFARAPPYSLTTLLAANLAPRVRRRHTMPFAPSNANSLLTSRLRGRR